MHFTLASFTSLLSPAPPTIYRNSRGGVGGVQVFSQQSAVMNLQTLPLRIQLLPNDQHVAVVQVMHHLRHTWSPCCRQTPTYDRIIGSVRVAGMICYAYTQRLACHTECSPLTSTQAISLHHCACDVKLFEGCHAQRTPQVAGRPDESIGSCDGDFRFTGWQHHHYCLDVWD